MVWSDRPKLRDPVLALAFKGWNDAGESASAALELLIDRFDAKEIAHIDPEDFYDFTAVRPTIRLVEGTIREIEWPRNVLYAAQVDGADRDLLVLQGTEPSLRWRAFIGMLIDSAKELGVRRVVSLGALLADVPHTRPVAVTGIASDDSLVEKLGFTRSSYQGPTGIVGVLHSAFKEAGIESVSLWASVPHYVAAAPNPKAALALIRGFEGVGGMAVDASELESDAVDYERQVSAAVASDPEVKEFVERLEEAMDEADVSPTPERIPSAETIARDFQRFLRQRGPDETE
jgi:proteasome assembly chaperone (PAC2) family protein